MNHLRVGTSLDKCIDMGAIIDEGQRKSVEQFVEEAKAEGAEVSLISPYLFCCPLKSFILT